MKITVCYREGNTFIEEIVLPKMMWGEYCFDHVNDLGIRFKEKISDSDLEKCVFNRIKTEWVLTDETLFEQVKKRHGEKTINLYDYILDVDSFKGLTNVYADMIQKIALQNKKPIIIKDHIADHFQHIFRKMPQKDQEKVGYVKDKENDKESIVNFFKFIGLAEEAVEYNNIKKYGSDCIFLIDHHIISRYPNFKDRKLGKGYLLVCLCCIYEYYKDEIAKAEAEKSLAKIRNFISNF